MAKESTYATATPLGTDYVRLVDDPTGTPSTKNATVVSLADATNGAVVYRIWDGMSDAINTVWQNFWAETAKAVLIIEPKASGVYTLNNDDVTCTGSAATAEKYVFGNNQEVYTASGSLLWRGATGASNNRVLFIDRLFYSAYAGNADSTGAGLVFQNTNWNHIDVRCKSTKVVVGTHTAGGQCEFNWMRFDLQNCDTTSPLHFAAYSSGDGSMRGNQIHARIFGTTAIDNAWRCAMTLYHSNVEIHVGGIGGAGGSPSTDPTTAGYTGANAVFWIEYDGSTDAGLHGSRLVLRDERGTGTGKVGLWLEDNTTARRQEHSHIDFASIYAYDYMAVADFADPSELPRFSFGINQQTQVNSWTADDGSWKIPVMRWDGGRYNIIDVPGVFADGVTDVNALIGAALSNGGAWYFPPGNYHLGAGVNITHTTDLDVECAAGVLFSTNGETIDDDLFDFDTNVTDNDLVSVRWVGGVFNVEGLYQSPTRIESDQGLLNIGAAGTHEVLSFRDGYWRSVHVEGAQFFTKTDMHVTDPRSIAQHWMGTYTAGSQQASGGDSGIYANSGPGSVTIRDCLFAGFVDSCVYIDGQGNTETTPPGSTLVEGCRFFWSTSAVALKGELTNAVVANCTAYGVARPWWLQAQVTAGDAGADRVTIANCTADIYDHGFTMLEADQAHIVGCSLYRAGYYDWSGSARGSTGRVTLTGGASGSVDSITIAGVNGGSNILTGAVNFNTDLETTAGLVVTDINSGTGTHGIAASTRENPSSAGDWIIYLHTTADGAEVNGNAVTSSATTITTSDTAMSYMFDSSFAVDIEGCTGTVIDGLVIDGLSPLFSSLADSRTVSAFRIRSLESASSSTGADVQTLDTTIRNLHIDGISAIGGEVTVSAVSDPDRTQFYDIHYGDSVTDHSAPTLLGAESTATYAWKFRTTLSTNETRTSTTTFSDTALSIPVKANAEYLITGPLVVFGADTGDCKFQWNDPDSGTADGRWTVSSAAASSSGATSSTRYEARTYAQALTSVATQTGGAESYYQLRATYKGDTDGSLVLQFAQNTSDATASELEAAGTWLMAERIG